MTRCECGKFAYSRQAIGPKGSQQWTVLVDACTNCGRQYPLHPEHLTSTQRKWLERRNARWQSAS